MRLSLGLFASGTLALGTLACGPSQIAAEPNESQVAGALAADVVVFTSSSTASRFAEIAGGFCRNFLGWEEPGLEVFGVKLFGLSVLR